VGDPHLPGIIGDGEDRVVSLFEDEAAESFGPPVEPQIELPPFGDVELRALESRGLDFLRSQMEGDRDGVLQGVLLEHFGRALPGNAALGEKIEGEVLLDRLGRDAGGGLDQESLFGIALGIADDLKRRGRNGEKAGAAGDGDFERRGLRQRFPLVGGSEAVPNLDAHEALLRRKADRSRAEIGDAPERIERDGKRLRGGVAEEGEGLSRQPEVVFHFLLRHRMGEGQRPGDLRRGGMGRIDVEVALDFSRERTRREGEVVAFQTKVRGKESTVEGDFIGTSGGPIEAGVGGEDQSPVTRPDPLPGDARLDRCAGDDGLADIGQFGRRIAEVDLQRLDDEARIRKGREGGDGDLGRHPFRMGEAGVDAIADAGSGEKTRQGKNRTEEQGAMGFRLFPHP